MTDLAPAQRRRRFWFDPRFAIGILLVVASVGGVLSIVSSADASTQVYAARDAIAPGDRIDAGDLVAVSVRIDQSGELYLAPGDMPEEGLVVVRSVGDGELVPASAIGSAAGLRLASVVVTLNGQLPESITPGAVVDLWAASQQESSSFGPPSVIVTGATVVREVESEGLVASGDVSSLELLVPRSKVARVLEAIANEDSLSAIPASIPVRG
jgi:hypothetical protein